MKFKTATEISQLILTQVEASGITRWPHGVELDRCLIAPKKIDVISRSVSKGKVRDAVERVWLVLEEAPRTTGGYKIVFNLEREVFGLASYGNPSDPYPVICGWYGDFPSTLSAM